MLLHMFYKYAIEELLFDDGLVYVSQFVITIRLFIIISESISLNRLFLIKY
jgi:hypothetical protein